MNVSCMNQAANGPSGEMFGVEVILEALKLKKFSNDQELVVQENGIETVKILLVMLR
jgi:hypothetical protein